jgi:hypothetical protein
MALVAVVAKPRLAGVASAAGNAVYGTYARDRGAAGCGTARDEPETSRQDAGGVEDRGETAEPQTGAEKPSTNWERSQEETERRPWWVRWFGG